MDVRQGEGVEARDDAKQRTGQPDQQFDMNELVQRMRSETEWQQDGRNQIALVKNGPLRVSLHVFQTGKGIPEHHVNGPVALHVHHGRVRVTGQGRDAELGGGGLISFDANEKFSVVASEESVVLLIVAHAEQVSETAGGNYAGTGAGSVVA